MSETKEIKDFELKLTGFEFPEKLSGNKANFRFVVDLRFIDKHGRFAAEHAVMPSLDTFWECDPNRYSKPNYVRGGTKDKPENKFVFKKSSESKKGVDEWDSLILHVEGKSLHSIQFKVIDVDRKDAWDTVKNVLGKVAETVIGKARGFILRKELPFPTAMGAAADDVQSFLLKKLAGGDKVLFRGSKLFAKTETKYCEIAFSATSEFAAKIKNKAAEIENEAAKEAAKIKNEAAEIENEAAKEAAKIKNEAAQEAAKIAKMWSFLCDAKSKNEKFLFERISASTLGGVAVSGKGTEGNYEITFEVKHPTGTE